MEHDALVKCASFIRSSVELRETFAFSSPVEVLTATKTHYYGSMLWDLNGDGANKMFNFWTTAVKLAWCSYLVQEVLACGLPSAKVEILSRYGNFFRSLRQSPSLEVAALLFMAARDIRSTTGSNLKLFEEKSGLNPWMLGSDRLKESLVSDSLTLVPEQDLWRISYLKKLLESRQQLYYGGRKDLVEEINPLIDRLCIN